MRVLHDHLTWMRLRGLRPTTIYHRRKVLLSIWAALAISSPIDVTADALAEWQQRLVASPQTHATYVSHLRGFYGWATDRDLVPSDPTRRLIRPRVPRRLPRPIGDDDLALAVAAAPFRVRPWLLLAGWAGLRACEIAPMRRSQVHDAAAQPSVTLEGKGGKERVVPLGPNLLDALRPWLARPAWLFPRADGKPGPTSRGVVSHVANDYLHSLGIPDTLHSLRHRFGTQLYARSLDLRLVGEMMGHSDPATTAGYVAYSRPAAAAAVTDLDETLVA